MRMVDDEYIVREEVWEKYGVFLDTASDRKLVTELNLANKDIADLTPLEKLTSLTKLDLYKNQITDLTPLAGLVRLEELGLGSNEITDLSPLTGLKRLEHLNLEDNPNLAGAQIDKLKRPMPKCRIVHNAKH